MTLAEGKTPGGGPGDGPPAAPAAEHDPGWLTPRATSSGTSPALPETAVYRLKRRLLGPPLVSEQIHTERLGKPTALAVLSSDVMSSAAYATESVLRILIPVAGVGAFVLITPITGLLLVVLGAVCLCYRNVVRAYPVSGGSYVVSRENFGYAMAQIPGAALLCSYTLTVAVSVAAGVDAVLSAFPGLGMSPTLLSVLFVALLTFGNLRGIREAGRVFAVPTYWFLASMALLIVVAAIRFSLHGVPHMAPAHGQLAVGPSGPGLLLGASVFLFLRGFANGGSAMTGMEAISNAVTVFREPQVRNARTTLVLMAGILGGLFLTVSVLAALTHAVPYLGGTPTVLSEIGRLVFGTGAAGQVAYYSLQFSTALILILGANTSFNGFPLLVNFIAQDSYLPRPLTTRGHRLVYSNGILLLAGLSIVLLVVTHANVANLIPLYATTVFTGFTMAGAGMTRYYLRRQEADRRRGLIVSVLAFVTSGVVTLIFVITEFSRGAWAVVVVIPLLIYALSRTHRRYQAEREVLAEEVAPAIAPSPMLRHQEILVLVDRLDLATARGLQLARSIAAGGAVRAVHFSLDEERTHRLMRGWQRFGLGPVGLEVIECPDRRLLRAVAEMADDLARDGETEVLLILPRRASRGPISRVLHDQTADRIVSAVTQIPHVSATIAPFDVNRLLDSRVAAPAGAPTGAAPGKKTGPRVPRVPRGEAAEAKFEVVPDTVPLGEVKHRQRVTVSGRVRAVRMEPRSGVPTFECTLVDDSGALTIAFLGRRSVPGIQPGVKLLVEGTVGVHHGRLAMLNPLWQFLEPVDHSRPASSG